MKTTTTTVWSHVTYLIDENRAENDCLLAELLKRWPSVHFRVVPSDNDRYREMIVSDATWDDHNKDAIYYFVGGFTKGWCEGWIARGHMA